MGHARTYPYGFGCILISIAIMLGGCQGSQLSITTIDVASTIEAIQSKQTINNLGRVAANIYTIPSQVLLNGGTVQIVNSVTPSITFPLSSMFSRTIAATSAEISTTAGSGASLGASVSWQENFNILPVVDPFSLRNLNILYNVVLQGLGKKEAIKNYQVPRSYDRSDRLVPDPYYFLNPSCVLCLSQASITQSPPEFPLSQHNISEMIDNNHLIVNDVFTYHGMFYRSSSDPSGTFRPFTVDKGSLENIGSSSGFAFYVAKKAYSLSGNVLVKTTIDGKKLFSDFVLLTLPLVNIPQRFSSIPASKAPASAGTARGRSSATTLPGSVNNGAEGSRSTYSSPLVIQGIQPNPQ